MKNIVKAGFLTICMTALATAPIVTITTIATADAAYAKSGNAGGGSNAGGKGKGKDKAGSAKLKGGQAKGKWKAKGQSAGKVKNGGSFKLSNTAGGKKIKNFFDKVTGQDKKASRTVSRTSLATVPETIEQPPKRGRHPIEGMHASQLGNANASLNANFNAVLAHIRNGNTNGPIGSLAALSVATRNAEGADKVVEVAAAYEAAAKILEDDYGYEGATAEDIVQKYLLEGDGENKEANAIIDERLTLTVDEETKKLIPYPEGDTLDEARDELADLREAQAGVIETWNKSDEATIEETKALLDALDARIEENAEAIDEIIGNEPDDEHIDYDEDMDGDLVECEEVICPAPEELAVVQ